MRLGAIHVPAPAHVPLLGQRARLDLMAAPQSVDWHKICPANGDPVGNDGAGCCVPAADYQEICLRLWNAGGERVWRPNANLVLTRYSRLTGYVEATGVNDDGTDTAQDTADFCTTGIRINDSLLDIPHWATLAVGNRIHQKLAVAHLCAVQMTVNLPIALQDQDFTRAPGTGSDWEAGSWGMHRVLSGKYDGDWFTIRTWGLDKPVHPEFLDRYLVAAEVRISRTWLESTGLAPSGIDWDALMADRLKLAA